VRVTVASDVGVSLAGRRLLTLALADGVLLGVGERLGSGNVTFHVKEKEPEER
jgi:hypothetical protein